MITLYHNDMSVCAAKVRIALAEKNLVWDGVHLNLRAGDAQKPDYLKLNPRAVVPTLVHEGRTIIESTVICEYIDDEWPDPPLKPADSWERAQMRVWTKQLDEGVHAAVGTLSFCIAFRHQWLARPAEDRAKWLAGMPQPDARRGLQSILERGLQSQSFEPAVRRCARLFEDLERALGHGDWLVGQHFSLADIGYAPYLARLRHLGFDMLFDRHPKVAAWSRQVGKRPSVLEGLERWFNPAYLELFSEKRSEAQAVVANLVQFGH